MDDAVDMGMDGWGHVSWCVEDPTGGFYGIVDKLRYVAKQDILTEFEEKQYEEHTEAHIPHVVPQT